MSNRRRKKGAEAKNVPAAKPVDPIKNPAQYAVGLAKQSLGVSKTNQNSITSINTEIIEVRTQERDILGRLAFLDHKMATYDTEDIQPLYDMFYILRDLVLNLYKENDELPTLTKEDAESIDLDDDADYRQKVSMDEPSEPDTEMGTTEETAD